MASDSEVLQWKEQWGSVFKGTVLDIEFIWRPLTRKEFKDISTLYDEDLIEELICTTCILAPDYDFFDQEAMGTLPHALSDIIIANSCLDSGSIKHTLKEYRRAIDTFEHQMDLVIHEGFFGNYTMEDIQGWTMEKTLARFAQAEWKLKTLRGVPLSTEDENELPPEFRPPEER